MEKTQITLDLHHEVARLTGEPARTEIDADTRRWGAWLGDDLIGSGEVESEALADAIATVRGWK